MMQYPWGKGTPKWTRDAAANDSDKSFTVPTGKIWDLKTIVVNITATATVGNRLLVVGVTDGTNVVYVSPKSGNITASQTASALFTIDLAQSGTTANNVPLLSYANPNTSIYFPLPKMVLPAGYIVRVYDYAAIDAAADDMIVVLHYVEYDA